MATSRVTATNENISTYGGAGQGRDYTSLGTWEQATDNDLVTATQSEVLECYADEVIFDDSINLNDATTNTSYFRIIRPAGVKGEASWQGHDGTPNTGVFFKSATDVELIDIGEANSSVQDIIVEWDSASTANRTTIITTGGNNLLIGVILNGATNGTNDARGFSIRGNSDKMVNCLAQNVDRHGVDLNADNVSQKVYAANCTSVNNGERGFIAGNGTTDSAVAINCLAYGNSIEDFEDPSGTAEWNLTNSKNNASEDVTAADFTNGRGSQTFTFRNVGPSVSIDGSASTGKTTSTGVTISHTTGTGSNRLMLVGVSFGQGSTSVTGITYDTTQDFTLEGVIAVSERRTEIWSLVAPNSGTADVVVSFAGSASAGAVAGVMTFTDVYQRSPTGTFVSASASSGTPSVVVSGTSQGMVFDTLCVDNSTDYSYTAGAGQTKQWEDFQSSDCNGAGSTEPGAASVTMSWNATDKWALAAVPITPAADDFHLDENDAGARGYGFTLSSFDDDVDFETRSGSWDIGFDQYVATAGGWSAGKINTIIAANLGKVNTVTKANISKINEV